MRTIILCFFLTALSWVIYSHFQYNQALAQVEQSSAPIVVELFTSQSCSSCPPADRLLGELSQKQNVIALACHVTYWDHLHWKDTLSLKSCTDRQRHYSALHGRRNVFTPQIIVNGRYSAVGSRTGDVGSAMTTAINQAEKIPAPILPPITKQASGHYQITIPETLHSIYDAYDVRVFFYKKAHFQSIKSGENRGLSHSYTHPVVDIAALPASAGTHKVRTDKNHDHVAVLIQDKRTGTLIAAQNL